MKLCFASHNVHKLKEIKVLIPSSIELVSLYDIGCTEDIPETQSTLEGNSLQKAETVFQKYKINCFADDTGLEVEALNNEPGVRSARYAGDQKDSRANVQLLLKNLEGIENRCAHFRTIITLLWEGNRTQFEGKVEGVITKEEKGNQGFGYDGLFIPKGQTHTFGEMDLNTKNKFNHRAIALQKLIDFLEKI